MKMGYRLATGLIVGAVAASAPQPLLAQAQQRAMYVSVVDEKGSPVPGLGPADFVVREDNVTREVLQVTPATDPIHIALLIDTSQAASDFIRDYREALPSFLDAVLAGPPAGRNQVAVVAIGERPTILADYTPNRELLMKAVDRLFALHGSGTYLLDAVMEVSRGLQKRQAARAVIVAVTSEGPELSDRHYQTVLETLRAGGATLHVLSIGRPANMAEDRAMVLSIGPRDTGGRYDTLLVSTALESRLKQLATEIGSQYRITYARPQRLIPPERVTVTTNRPKLTARGIPVREPAAGAQER